MQFDKKILGSLQESVQVWDTNGNKIFSNNKASLLYGLQDEEIKTIDDILRKWSFFDSREKSLSLSELPTSKALKLKESLSGTILKMVCGEDVKWINTSVTPILTDEGEIEAIVTTCLDITHLKSQEIKYKNIANYDPLTKLPNRLLLSDRLDFAMAHANRNKTSIAVCMIDLDGFKALNDTLGHDAGDAVLIEASRRMTKVLRDDDTVARLGGDEFVVILTNLNKTEECAISLYRVLNAISAPYIIGEKEVTTISASIGVSIYPEDKVEPEILLRHADVAMYKSKNSGKNKFSFFNIASDQKIKANFRTLGKIKKALQEDEFCLYYQPKVNSFTGQILEVEALARWAHPLLGLISPNEFLPLIESEEELSHQFDQWVMAKAIKQLQEWHSNGLYIKICVNISPKEFKQKDFMLTLKDVFLRCNASLELLSYLEFEILETAAVENLSKSNEIIKECKKLGINFALDDFGTGFSSLMHLKELNIDTIKIDRTFVMAMLESSEDMAIVQAVIGLANAFDINVTAEGAENIEQVLSLIGMGCDEIQGYAIARPMPKKEMEDFIATFVPDPRWKLVYQNLPSKADFELLLAESNHKYWLDLILYEFSKLEMEEELFSHKHTECRFGAWFEKTKHKNYKKTASFKDLDIAHQQMHQNIQKMYHKLKNEKRVINEDEKEEILKRSEELTAILDKIRKEVERIKYQANSVNKILQKRKQYAKQQ